MIFVTGDIHSDVSRLSENIFTEQAEMTKDDYLIILGDFGLVWNLDGESKYETQWLDWLESRPFTTLFVDGNHENFARLNSYPVEEWKGGKIQRIRPSVIHLMRGQVYNINDKTIFTFGGARSIDKAYRTENKSWWKEEMPSKTEELEGINNLEKVNWKVDFILTHCCASSTQSLYSHGKYKTNDLTNYLETVRSTTEFKKWLFGHYHDNKAINDKEIVIYEQIIRIA